MNPMSSTKMPANAEPGAITAGASVSRQASPKQSASTPHEMKRSSRPVTARRAPAGGVAAAISSGTSAAGPLARARPSARAAGLARCAGPHRPPSIGSVVRGRRRATAPTLDWLHGTPATPRGDMFDGRDHGACPTSTSSSAAAAGCVATTCCGRRTVLYFYPKDDTPGAPSRAASSPRSSTTSAPPGVEVYGVSPDSPTQPRALRRQVRAGHPADQRPRPRAHRGPRAVGREVDVRAHLQGGRAQHVPGRTGRRRGARVARRQGRRPRRRGARGGASCRLGQAPHAQRPVCSTSSSTGASSSWRARAAPARRPSPPRSACSPPSAARRCSASRSTPRATSPPRSAPRARASRPRWCSRSVSVLALHAEESFQEYLRLYFKVPRLARMTPLSRVFDFIATAVPGPRDMLVTGKIAFEERRRDDAKRPVWDLIVVDCSASGHILAQLRAARSMLELVRGGVIRSQIEWIDSVHLRRAAAPLRCSPRSPRRCRWWRPSSWRATSPSSAPCTSGRCVLNRMPPEPLPRGRAARPRRPRHGRRARCAPRCPASPTSAPTSSSPSGCTAARQAQARHLRRRGRRPRRRGAAGGAAQRASPPAARWPQPCASGAEATA